MKKGDPADIVLDIIKYVLLTILILITFYSIFMIM